MWHSGFVHLEEVHIISASGLESILNSLSLGDAFRIDFSAMVDIQKSYPDEISTKRLYLKKKFTGDIAVIYLVYLMEDHNNSIGSVDMYSDGEIWYQISSGFRNQGYVTEAVSKIISISTAPSFYLSICSTNSASLRVAEKLGFKYSETRGTYQTFVYAKP